MTREILISLLKLVNLNDIISPMNQKLLALLIKGITIKKIHGNTNIPVIGITYDSRKVEPGFIFTALGGFHTEGHLYIDQAIKNGARVIVYEKEVDDYVRDLSILCFY